MIRYKSYAKVNLFLDIVSRLKNGYHKIRSVFSEISLYDQIEIIKNNKNRINIIDNKNILPENNLLKKAADIYINNYRLKNIGMNIIINKNIPIGGGLGGGSSNAASVLKIINNEFKNKNSKYKLKKIGAKLGSDVPFFINGGVQKVSGTGNKLKKIRINNLNLHLLLVFPEIKILTKYAYDLIDENELYHKTKFYNKNFNNFIISLKSNDYKNIIKFSYNVFEEVIYDKYPDLQTVYNDILNANADKALLSGSGSTLFGMFKNKKKAIDAKNILERIGYKCTVVDLLY